MNTKQPVGNGIAQPVLDHTKESMQSPAVPTSKDLGLNGTYNQANLSAKFKNPQKKQDRIPAAGQNQYESTN